jgi:hypothetical protein
MESAVQNVKKIQQKEYEIFHADGKAGMTKVILAFRNCATVDKVASTWHREYSTVQYGTVQ